MTLQESDKDIMNMIQILDIDTNRCKDANIKLYVSCINECPIEGKIDNDIIVNRLLKLNKLKISSICLSDTCGTLEPDDFKYIIDTCSNFGIPATKFSLHLHTNNSRMNITEQIIHLALDHKIKDFDVSLLDSGGCSITMEKCKILPNLSYELYYKCLIDYIMKKID